MPNRNQYLLHGLMLGGLMGFAHLASAADAQAGKRVADAQCAKCHQPKDWAGETSSSLESLLRDVASGKIKHNKAKVQLTPIDIADVAAYWLSGGK